MNCVNCNSVNDINAKFCVKCGAPLMNVNNNLSSGNVGNFVHPNVVNNMGMQSQMVGHNHTENSVIQPKKGKTNKALIFGIIACLLVLLGCGVFFFFRGNSIIGGDTKDLNLVFDPAKPIVVKKDGKYGYIMSDGKMMIEPKFETANPFNGEYAIVSVLNPESSYYFDDKIYQIIDRHGNVLFSSESYISPSYFRSYGVWIIDGSLYDSKLKRITEEGYTISYIDEGYFKYQNIEKDESGIMDYTGKKIFSWEGYSIIIDISENDNADDDLFATVTNYDDKEIIIRLKDGKTLYSLDDVENKYIYADDDNIFRVYNRTDRDYEAWFFFYDGELKYQSSEDIYDLEVVDFDKRILLIDYGYDYDEMGKKQRRYYYDVKNDKMFEEKPESLDIDIDLMELNFGYKTFNSSSKYGLMSGDKIVVPCEYDDVEFLNVDLHKYLKSKGKELVLLEKDDKMLLYNLKNNKTISTFDSTYVADYDDSTFLKISLYEDYTVSGYIIYNLLSGKSISVSNKDSFDIYSNYITVLKDGKLVYYNTDLKEIYSVES